MFRRGESNITEDKHGVQYERPKDYAVLEAGILLGRNTHVRKVCLPGAHVEQGNDCYCA